MENPNNELLSENIETAEASHVQEIPRAYTAEQYSNAYEDAIDRHNQQLKDEEEKKALTEFILSNPQGRNKNTAYPDKGVEYSVPQKNEQISGIKKFGIVLATTFATLFPFKEAKAQQKMHSDKERNKTEAITNTEFHELSEKNKSDWHQYVEYVKHANLLNDPRMNTKVFADMTLKKFIKEHPQTSLTLEMVKNIQQEFINYKAWAIEKVREGKIKFAEGVTEENFMPISPNDDIAGAKTIHDFPHEYVTYLEEKKIKGTVDGKDIEYVYAQNQHTVNKGFMHSTDTPENK